MTEQVRIEDVIVGERARRDYGDLDSLKASIREHGLLQPIGLAPGNHLLFGGRRLEACRQLGMTVIDVTRPATQTDAVYLLKAERDENTCRKDMTAEELVDIGLRLEALERPRARERQGARSDLTSGPTGPEVTQARRTDDVVADALGTSRNTYQRMKHVVTTARDEDAEPEVREAARDALRKMNAGEISPTAADRDVRASRGGVDGRKRPDPEPRLAVPQPPRYGGNRRKHAQAIAAMNLSLSGYALVASEITELDASVTTEEAARLADDLSNSIRALTRLKQLLTRKATS